MADSIAFSVANLAGTSTSTSIAGGLDINGVVVPAEIEVQAATTISVDTAVGTGTSDVGTLVRYTGDLTIDATKTLRPSVRKLFTAIYVNGNLTVNGTLSMTSRGGKSLGQTYAGANILIIKGTEETVSGVNRNLLTAGAAGGVGRSGVTAGNAGANAASNFACGGGGAGGWGGAAGKGGSGGQGSAFSGGTGGGAQWDGGADAMSGQAEGGAGGNYGNHGTGGGGNPGGLGEGGNNGTDGTGGVLLVFVTGNVTIGASGSIEANGVQNSDADTVKGGSTGGGVALVLYQGTYSNSGSLSATGGAANTGTFRGGAGGNGTTSAALSIFNLTSSTSSIANYWNKNSIRLGLGV